MSDHRDDVSKTRKRKLEDNPEIEIDVSAPEPPSKKALRKAKKAKETLVKPSEETPVDGSEGSKEEVIAESQSKPTKQRTDFGIWIGNLPFNATKEDLRKFFTNNAAIDEKEITRVHLPEGPKQRGRSQNKGFAYIDFSTSNALEQALPLSELLLSGRRVLIKNSTSFAGRPEKTKQSEDNAGPSLPSGKAPSQKIFVGNLDFDQTKESIEEHFSKCGTVTHVHVATFEDTGKCKGFAWVEFEELESAESAVRGFVKVPEEEEEEEVTESGSEGEKQKPKKKEKKAKFRKAWVNRINGRQLRMEFAEDKATRYKKRYGKEGTAKNPNGQSTSDTNTLEENGDPIVEVSETRPERAKKERTQKPRGDYDAHGRYDKETVQRLSGAIVESKGKKVTFD